MYEWSKITFVKYIMFHLSAYRYIPVRRSGRPDCNCGFWLPGVTSRADCTGPKLALLFLCSERSCAGPLVLGPSMPCITCLAVGAQSALGTPKRDRNKPCKSTWGHLDKKFWGPGSFGAPLWVLGGHISLAPSLHHRLQLQEIRASPPPPTPRGPPYGQKVLLVVPRDFEKKHPSNSQHYNYFFFF